MARHMTTGFVEIPVKRNKGMMKDFFNFADKHNGLVCGGSVRYACSPLKTPIPSNDIDIYGKTPEAWEELVAACETLGFAKGSESPMAVTFEPPPLDVLKDKRYSKEAKRLGKYGFDIQIIKPIENDVFLTYGSVEEIIDHFDFTVSRVGLVAPGKALADEHFLDDEKKKMIRIAMVHCPLSSVPRIIKYAKKGYWVTMSELIKLFIDWELRGDDWKADLIALITSDFADLTDEDFTRLEHLLRID